MIDNTDHMDDRRIQARQSATGRSLTHSQFEGAWAISGILAHEIHRDGRFREKLSDYAHAFSRSEPFDTLKGEGILRDIFQVRYGETMNQMRERLTTREKEREGAIVDDALEHARWVPDLIGMGSSLTFYRAYDQAAVALSEKHGITEKGAKEMMTVAFASHEGRELYEAGKEAEKLYYKPARQEGEERQRKNENSTQRQKNWSRS